jgi:hypothetical protein
MANVKNSVITFAADGMNDSAHPAFLQSTSCARMTNCQIKNQLPSTRPGIRVHKLGDDGNPFMCGNIQGATYYNPALGQSQLSFGADQDSIMVSVAGRRLHLTFGPTGLVSVSDQTGDHPGIDHVHFAWIYQAENYVICQDGISPTWIWNGAEEAFVSNGYRNDLPEDSQLANQATQGCYIHGRIAQVVDRKKIIVGDIIHEGTFNSTSNILQTKEQVYYATGAFFSPPSALGEIRALAILPLRDTAHGHSDLVVHCRRGVYSLKLDGYPRSEWINNAVAKHMLLDTGAEGQYALTVSDGDQMFRSRHGIQSIRSTAAQAESVGNPYQTLSEPVSSWVKTDHLNLLRFCSMERWNSQNRILFTVGLWMDGSQRGGKGIVSLNLNPAGSLSPEKRSWEGLWTLPSGVSRPVQMVSGLFTSGEKLLVLCTDKPDECNAEFKNSLVEFDTSLTHDILEDGTISRISSQLITGAYPLENIASPKNFHEGKVTFTKVTGKLDWGVWCRNDMDGAWVEWKKGSFDCGSNCEADSLDAAKPTRIVRNLRAVPAECRTGQFIQCLIRWRGSCSLESLEIGYEEIGDSENLGMDGEKFVESAPCDYSDYEYSQEESRWEQA